MKNNPTRIFHLKLNKVLDETITIDNNNNNNKNNASNNKNKLTIAKGKEIFEGKQLHNNNNCTGSR